MQAITDYTLLSESIWARATRDTWPRAWFRKWMHRVSVAAISLGALFLLSEQDERSRFFQSIQTAGVGVIAFIAADLILYPWNLLLAARRQRDECRAFIRANRAAQHDFARLSLTTQFYNGDTWRIAARNTGTRLVKSIRISVLNHADWVVAVGWSQDTIVIEEIRPQEEASVPFMATKAIGMQRKPVRVRLAGMDEKDEPVSAEIVLDPYQL